MTIQDTLDERQKTHGDYSLHAECTQTLKHVIRMLLDEHDRPPLKMEHQEALDMILHKIGRIVAGDPNFEDHWHDIAGYAELARQACSSTPKSNPHTAESAQQSGRSSAGCTRLLADRHNDSIPLSPSGRPL